jgi:hypothetical protein
VSLPISSRRQAAEATKISSSRPARRTKSFITNSHIGDLQILPWQTKRIFVIGFLLPEMPQYAVVCRIMRVLKKEQIFV